MKKTISLVAILGTLISSIGCTIQTSDATVHVKDVKQVEQDARGDRITITHNNGKQTIVHQHRHGD